MLSPLDAIQSIGILIISSTLLACSSDSRRQLLKRLLSDRFSINHQILLLGYSRFEFELSISTMHFTNELTRYSSKQRAVICIFAC
jgi:hypothetical protein